MGAVTATPLALAGCLSLLSNDDTNDARVALSDIILLVSPTVESVDQVEVDLRVRWDHSTVHEAVYELDRTGVDSDVLIAGDEWPDGPGMWEVAASVDGGKLRAISTSDVRDGLECVRLIGMVEELSTPGLFFRWLHGEVDC